MAVYKICKCYYKTQTSPERASALVDFPGSFIVFIDHFLFIGPKSDHWECLSVTHWLTNSVTFSKLDWCRPGMWRWQLKTSWGCYCCSGWWWDSCWQQFCADLEGEVWSSLKFLFRLWAQGFKVWSRFWSWCSGKILKLKFGHYFATDAWLWLWSSILVEILKLGLVKIYKFKFCRNADVWLRFWSWCLVKILKMFDQDLCMNSWNEL